VILHAIRTAAEEKADKPVVARVEARRARKSRLFQRQPGAVR
jgi:hypothetical protein